METIKDILIGIFGFVVWIGGMILYLAMWGVVIILAIKMGACVLRGIGF